MQKIKNLNQYTNAEIGDTPSVAEAEARYQEHLAKLKAKLTALHDATSPIKNPGFTIAPRGTKLP